MSQYFQNAAVVIAASKANDVQEGFLQRSGQKQQQNLFPRMVEADCSTTTRVPFFDPSGRRRSIVLNASPQIYSPSTEPLNKRAWTLQERLLCPRVLIFPSSGGFALQCEKEEQYNESIVYSVIDLCGREKLFKPRVAIHTTGHLSEASILEDSWRDLVSDYNLRLISDPADKLIAIAGLAEMYSQEHGVIFGR
jgi:hypothetical protein